MNSALTREYHLKTASVDDVSGLEIFILRKPPDGLFYSLSVEVITGQMFLYRFMFVKLIDKNISLNASIPFFHFYRSAASKQL